MHSRHTSHVSLVGHPEENPMPQSEGSWQQGCSCQPPEIRGTNTFNSCVSKSKTNSTNTNITFVLSKLCHTSKKNSYHPILTYSWPCALNTKQVEKLGNAEQDCMNSHALYALAPICPVGRYVFPMMFKYKYKYKKEGVPPLFIL